MLKRSTYVLLSLLLCIPLVFIVYFSLSDDTEKPLNSTLMRVDITNRDGYEITCSDKEELDLYYAAVGHASKIDHPVRDITGEVPTVIVYNEPDTAYTYQFYMSADRNECYFSDVKGTFYRLTENDAATLSSRREFAYLYDGYSLPTAQIATANGNYALTPNDNYEWKFLCGDEFADGFVDMPAESIGTIAFKNGESMALHFSDEPSRLEITVKRGETVVHAGEDLQELPTKLSYAADTPLTCEIKAEWLQTENSTYYGSATYTASLLYDVPATYTLVDARLSPGEFTILQFSNLNDDQTVTLVSELSLPPTKVHSVGNKKFVFLPIDVSAIPGKYTIKVIAGTEESSFNFTVGNKSFTDAQISTPHGSSAYDAAKTEFDNLIKSYGDQSTSERLWDDDPDGTYRFAKPVSADAANPAFGTKILADTNLKGSTPYRTAYLTYEAAEGTDVCATAAGKVVYAAENGYAGKAVILDHGCGVLSVYSNLSSIAVKVGDMVERAGVIGTTGKSGYIFNAGVKFAVVMDGVYVNPASNYVYGIRVS